jgi:hypothetical protein
VNLDSELSIFWVSFWVSEWLCVPLLRWAQLPREAPVRPHGKRRDLTEEVNLLLPGKLSLLTLFKRPMKHGLPKKTKDDCPRLLDADEKTTQSWEEAPVPPPGHTCIQQESKIKKWEPKRHWVKTTNFLEKPQQNLKILRLCQKSQIYAQKPQILQSCETSRLNRKLDLHASLNSKKPQKIYFHIRFTLKITV